MRAAADISITGAPDHPRRMHVAVDYSWREIGAIALDATRIAFPEAPAAPGIYRFDLGDRVYIGETDQLKRRFQHYRTPGVSQTTNIRLNAALADLLQHGAIATVATVTSATVEIDGAPASLDLSYRPARLLIESAALVAERHAGRRVENL